MNSTTGQTLLKLDDVYRDYDLGEVTVHALRGVTLEIAEGEFVAILGQSGSGKTTLLNMIAGLDIPTEGAVFFAGNKISDLDRDGRTKFRRENIGIVFQAFNLFPTLTALENVEIGISFSFISQSSIRNKAKEYLKLVGLGDKLDRYPSQLSGGEQQRVSISRGLAKEPPILVLDEPTGNLDAETSDEIWKLILKLNRETNTTTVAVTHQTSVSKIAHRSIFLRSGQIYGISAGQEV